MFVLFVFFCVYQFVYAADIIKLSQAFMYPKDSNILEIWKLNIIQEKDNIGCCLDIATNVLFFCLSKSKIQSHSHLFYNQQNCQSLLRAEWKSLKMINSQFNCFLNQCSFQVISCLEEIRKYKIKNFNIGSERLI